MNALLEKLSEEEMAHINGGIWVLVNGDWIWFDDFIGEEKNGFDKMQNHFINEDYSVGKGAR